MSLKIFLHEIVIYLNNLFLKREFDILNNINFFLFIKFFLNF
jgi:hypothetical protein